MRIALTIAVSGIIHLVLFALIQGQFQLSANDVVNAARSLQIEIIPVVELDKLNKSIGDEEGEGVLGGETDEVGRYQELLSRHLMHFLMIYFEDNHQVFTARIMLQISNDGTLIKRVIDGNISMTLRDKIDAALDASLPLPTPPKNITQGKPALNVVVPFYYNR